MEMKSLLIEQRCTGDKCRLVERDMVRHNKILAGSDLGAVGRRQAEEALSSSLAELTRLSQRMLELDASVTIAALQAP